MSLIDCQRSLVGLVRGSQAEYLSCKSLNTAEEKWLSETISSPGLSVTRQTQQWWRITRVCSTSPLTIELLKRFNQDQLVIDYINSSPVRTLFFVAELEQFKLYLQSLSQVDEEVKTLIEFETAIKTAYQVSINGVANHRGGVSATTRTLCFKRDPVKLLSALLTGGELPLKSKNNYISVGPDLPEFWCLLGEHENKVD